MLQPPPQLEYAPAAPIRRRKRIRRALTLLTLAALSLAIWKYHAPVWHQAQLLYYERQCLTYTAPPDQVVYDEDDGVISPLINAPGYAALPPAPDYSQFTVTSSTARVLSTVAVRPAQALQDFATALNDGTTFPGATVFLHELRTRGGLRRLVIVTRVPAQWMPFGRSFELTVHCFTPAGMTSPPFPDNEFPLFGLSTDDGQLPPTQRLRFYAGQPDPADPAHFTIRYDLLNQTGLIDGRLIDDKENHDETKVSLKVVSGPALNTKWKSGY